MSAVVSPKSYISGVMTGVERLHPATYISGIFTGVEKIKPKHYVSGVFIGTEIIRPKLYVTLEPPKEIKETVTIGTKRIVAVSGVQKADTIRKIAAYEIEKADTSREVRSSFEKLRYSTERKIKNTVTVSLDTARLVKDNKERIKFDTSRITAKDIFLLRFDLKRQIGALESDSFDLRRHVGKDSQEVKLLFDTKRTLGALDILEFETARKLVNVEAVKVDTFLRLPAILRYVSDQSAHTPGKIGDSFSELGVQTLSIKLGEQTLSDTFQLQTVCPLEINDTVKGKLLDYKFCFCVEEISQRDAVQSVKGFYDRNKTLYTAINIGVIEANVSYYARELAKAMGLKLNRLCDDFVPSNDYSESGMTYLDFVSSLFGWTSRLPQMQINVFIRDDTLNIIQRGYEKDTLDITDWPYNRPTIDRKLLRSIWSSNNNDSSNNHAHNDKDDYEPEPFNGTIRHEDIEMTYVDGYLVTEKNKDGETKYSYSGGYLTEKNNHNYDGSTCVTTYSYANTENDIFLSKEKEKKTDKLVTEEGETQFEWTDYDNENVTERITYHAPLGFGWYSTSVYVDGVLEGSSLSQGKPGNKASRFTINQANRALGSCYGIDGKWSPLGYTPLIDTEFPVIGEWYLQKLTKAIEWLNLKTQETVTLEICSPVRKGIPEISHIVDFTEKVRFKGNDYYLVSNQIELSPRSFLQKLQIVRWY